MKICKYKVPVKDYFTIYMPAWSRILSFDVQDGVPTIWVMVDPDVTMIAKRNFRLAGTGQPIVEDASQLEFIGTIQTYGGRLVFHLFEIKQRSLAKEVHKLGMDITNH